MRFSVIIPAYNAENYILRSVNSVLQQTYKDFEIIVVNDGSTDRTLNRLKSINDNRLFVISQKNQGVSVARNTGIRYAKGQFICFLDADDEYFPNHLEHLNDLINANPSYEFYSTRFCYSLRTNSKIIMPKVSGEVYYYQDVTSVLIKKPEIIWTGCVCIKREMFKKYGMFEPGIKLGEDTDMWQRIYVHTGVLLSDTITVKRNRDGSEATKFYTRRYEVDPLNRMPMFLSDETIPDNIKKSLKIKFELTKLQVVRSYIIDGNKKEAWKRLKKVDKEKISKFRIINTYFSLLLPSFVIRIYIKLKNRGLYEEKK